jgi:anthranilate synthase/aminodeoxychorismate synthase-like glutamine amidotransferase
MEASFTLRVLGFERKRLRPENKTNGGAAVAEHRLRSSLAPAFVVSRFPLPHSAPLRYLRRAMVLVIDNYDSFTYNLVQYLGELKVDLQVHRNDQISLDQIHALAPERILVSPGPCSPRESGLSNDIIREFGPKIPLFGVCLGHQCIGHTFGASVVVNYRMMHGKTSPIKHNGRDLFEGMPNPFAATRYHSLVIKRDSLPDFLEITAETEEGEIMGIRHKQLPIWGVQFHPESILTESGRTIMKNFLALKTHE